MTTKFLLGDSLETLPALTEKSVQCCVTSPPYFGLRDYGHPGQLGLEKTPAEYVERMVEVFREVKRVLRDDGTLWLNIGDSYAGGGNYRGINSEDTLTSKRRSNRGARGLSQLLGAKDTPGCKAKDLIGIPWMLAFALRADGWYLRSDIIWHKPNPMPESVTDRPTKSHEYLFLLSKSPTYYYDAPAIAEAGVGTEYDITQRAKGGMTGSPSLVVGRNQAEAGATLGVGSTTRNKRSVWTVNTSPYVGAHFATFPPPLIEPCIKAGSSDKSCEHCGKCYGRQVERTPMVIQRSERTHDRGQTRSSGTMLEPPTSVTLGFVPACNCGSIAPVPSTILDPFGGAGTTGLVADRLGRNSITCELNPAYMEMARRRIADDSPLFNGI